MKLSHSLGAATLALGLATAGCSQEEGPKKDETALKAEKASAMQKQAASATAAPTAAPAPAPTVVPAPTATQAPAPAPYVPAAVPVVDANQLDITNPELKASLQAVCDRFPGVEKPVLKNGNDIYTICWDGNTRIAKVLDDCKNTGASSSFSNAECREDRAGNTDYYLTHSSFSCNDDADQPLVLKIESEGNAQNTAASNLAWAHQRLSVFLLNQDYTGLPFTKDTEVVLATPQSCDDSAAVAKKTPKTPGQPTTPVQPAQPKTAVEKGTKDAEQDKRLAALEAEGAAARRDINGLQGRVGKLEDWAKEVKPSKDKPDLNAAADRRAQGKN